MNNLDFLDSLGQSKKNFSKLDFDKGIKQKTELLEILQSRNLMNEGFKNELLSMYINRSIDENLFQKNVKNSIETAEKIKLQILSIEDSEFKLKNDAMEYVGTIDKMPGDATKSNNINRGKISYNFAKQLFEHLKDKTLTLKDICFLSDLLDFKVLKVFNVKVIE